MNATLSTTAWVLHDLGLATSVGGAVFGKAGLHRGLDETLNENGRGEIVQQAWKNFTPINLLSHLAVGATWLVGRSALSGREISRSTHRLVIAKDALTGIYLATGLASTAAGYAVSELRKGGDSSVTSIAEGVGVNDGNTAELSRKLQRVSAVLGTTNLLAGAALLGLTAVLAMQAGRSTKWSLVSRFLP
jgi:hypothetical protein